MVSSELIAVLDLPPLPGSSASQANEECPT